MAPENWTVVLVISLMYHPESALIIITLAKKARLFWVHEWQTCVFQSVFSKPYSR